ncbi:group II intron maturase-specific domain-containing protein [Vibrio sp. 10N.247.311.18]
MKKRARGITIRNRGQELEVLITELTQSLRGWQHHFKLATSQSAIQR